MTRPEYPTRQVGERGLMIGQQVQVPRSESSGGGMETNWTIKEFMTLPDGVWVIVRDITGKLEKHILVDDLIKMQKKAADATVEVLQQSNYEAQLEAVENIVDWLVSLDKERTFTTQSFIEFKQSLDRKIDDFNIRFKESRNEDDGTIDKPICDPFNLTVVSVEEQKTIKYRVIIRQASSSKEIYVLYLVE